MGTPTRRGVRSHTAPSLLYVVPALVFFALFALLPLVLVVALSFTEWDGLGDPSPVGWANWSALLSDSAVFHSIRITVVLTVLSWATQTPVALLLGVWAAGRQRSRAVLSAVFFLPLLLSGTAVAIVWKSILNPTFGLAAPIGSLIGHPDGNFLGTGNTALLAIVLVLGWQFVSFHSLLYQAASRRIPRQLYEAATVDGAGRVGQFWHVTLPQLRHTVVTSSTIMVVGSLTYFETILIVTNGGPGTATQNAPFRMYFEAFRGDDMGYAATIASALVVVATLISLVIVRFSGFAKMRSTLEGL